MRPARLLAICVLVLAAPGCDSGDDDGADRTAPPEPPPAAEREDTTTAKARIIRHWLRALNKGNYGHAADFFVPGALIDQGIPYRLPNRAAARRWNSGLPCRADLVRVEPAGVRVLASFRLRDGPGGRCEGIVVVRFTFRGDRFSRFIQLQEEQLTPDLAEGSPI